MCPIPSTPGTDSVEVLFIISSLFAIGVRICTISPKATHYQIEDRLDQILTILILTVVLLWMKRCWVPELEKSS